MINLLLFLLGCPGPSLIFKNVTVGGNITITITSERHTNMKLSIPINIAQEIGMVDNGSTDTSKTLTDEEFNKDKQKQALDRCESELKNAQEKDKKRYQNCIDSIKKYQQELNP